MPQRDSPFFDQMLSRPRNLVSELESQFACELNPESMMRQIQANIDHNMRRNNDEMTNFRKQNEEQMRKLEARNLMALNKMTENHKNQMLNGATWCAACKAHAVQLAKLDETLKKTRKEGTEKVKTLEQQNEALKQELKKSHQENQKKIENLMEEHQKENEKAKEAELKLDETLKNTRKEGTKKVERLEQQNEALKQELMKSHQENQKKIENLMKEHQKENKNTKQVELILIKKVADEKQKLLQLEQKYQEEAAEKLDEELKRRIEFSATQDAMKKFLKITKTVKDVGESLNYIKAHCATKSSETMDNIHVEMYLNEILSSKSMLKEDVYRFEQLLINEQSVQQEVLRACKGYVHKYENLVDQEKFFNLCINLPSAIENKNQAEIEKFGKLAGDLSSELKDDREEIEKKLDQISSGNLQQSLE